MSLKNHIATLEISFELRPVLRLQTSRLICRIEINANERQLNTIRFDTKKFDA